MNQLNKAMQELDDVFEKFWSEYEAFSDVECRFLAREFFLKGFDVAVTAWNMHDNVKRSVSQLVVGTQGNLFALSNDGKVYKIDGFDNGFPRWLPYSDLPQD